MSNIEKKNQEGSTIALYIHRLLSLNIDTLSSEELMKHQKCVATLTSHRSENRIFSFMDLWLISCLAINEIKSVNTIQGNTTIKTILRISHY